MPVYSADRVTRLRQVVVVVLVLAVLLAAFSLVLLAGGEGEGSDRTAGLAGLVIAVVLAGAAGATFRLLASAERPAKVACVVTGAVTVLAGLALVGTWLAFLLPLLGAGLLFLALVGDEEAA